MADNSTVKIICECGNVRWVNAKVAWRTKYCESCAAKKKLEGKRKYRHQERKDHECEWLLISDANGMDLWGSSPTFNLEDVHRFYSGVTFRNVLTGEIRTT